MLGGLLPVQWRRVRPSWYLPYVCVQGFPGLRAVPENRAEPEPYRYRNREPGDQAD